MFCEEKGCHSCNKSLTVLGFEKDCEPSVRKKLLTFGLTPGTKIEIIRKAPLGDPIEIKVRGFLLSLRIKEFNSLVFEK